MDNIIKLVIAVTGGALALTALTNIIAQFTTFFNQFSILLF